MATRKGKNVELRDGCARFGIEIPIEDFQALAFAHYDLVKGTNEIEAQAFKLSQQGFPEADVIDFIREVCGWGGYSGISGRVRARNTPTHIRQAFVTAVEHLAEPKPDVAAALGSINQIKGLGKISFASKHLRFLCPEFCPVLDAFLQSALPYSLNSAGYAAFAVDCRELANELTKLIAPNPWRGPKGPWFAADVEAAIFQFVRNSNRTE